MELKRRTFLKGLVAALGTAATGGVTLTAVAETLQSMEPADFPMGLLGAKGLIQWSDMKTTAEDQMDGFIGRVGRWWGCIEFEGQKAVMVEFAQEFVLPGDRMRPIWFAEEEAEQWAAADMERWKPGLTIQDIGTVKRVAWVKPAEVARLARKYGWKEEWNHASA